MTAMQPAQAQPAAEWTTAAPRKLDPQRVKNARHLAEHGFVPPYSFRPTHAIADLSARFGGVGVGEKGPEVIVHGRVAGVRHMKKTAFLDLRDPRGVRVQVSVVLEEVPAHVREATRLLDLGDRVAAHGVMTRTQRNELSVQVRDWTLLSKCLQAAPSDGLDAENRLREPWLDRLFHDEPRLRVMARGRVKAALRGVMMEEGYDEIDPPLLSRSYGGASARPFETESHALDERLFLQISPEIALKKAIVGGWDAVYTITRNFRNEGIDPSHSPEFDAIECYRVGADYHDMMDLAERLVCAAAIAANGHLELEWKGHAIDLGTPWARVPMRDLVLRHYGLAEASLEDLRSLVERESLDVTRCVSPAMAVNLLFEARVQATLVQPTFVMDYPVEISPLTRAHRVTPGLVERFELFIAGMEFANAYSELNDAFEQERRLLAQDEERRRGDEEAHPLDWSFVDAMRCGFPPTGGLGIGVDRLIMLLTGAPTLRAVLVEPLVRTLEDG